MFGANKPIEISKNSFIVRENKQKEENKQEYKKPIFIALTQPEKEK